MKFLYPPQAHTLHDPHGVYGVEYRQALGGAVDPIEHEAMQMDVEIGGLAEALNEDDRAALGFGAFESRLFDQQPALDEDLYAELAASFPPPEVFLEGAAVENNRYYQYSAAESLAVNRALPIESLERVKTIAYAPNTLVVFQNGPDSIHGVSPRSATPHPRLHINFMAQFPAKLFSIGNA